MRTTPPSPPPLPPLPREVEEVVDLLCLVEAGRRVDLSRGPYGTVRWFLEHAARFRDVAFSAIGLLSMIADRGDEAMRARVAVALGPLSVALPSRGEPVLMRLASSPSPEVRSAVVDSLIELL